MSTKGAADTRSIVDAYHRGWTSRRFEESIRLLAPGLRVEVPINDYPTRESFAQALVGFGAMVDRVELLAEFAHGDEAMLLYDMDVQGLGRMRVAEHFTVKAGKIARLRQIHDTAAVRAAGLARDAPAGAKSAAGDGDYRRVLTVRAPAERLFDAIATVDGVRGWWTPRVKGSGERGETMRLEFEGLDEHIDLHVAGMRRPTHVEWSVIEHTSLDDWNATTIRFEIAADGAKASRLAFRHEGLSPRLECYERCEAGWDHFLSSLVAYAERGEGAPFSSGRRRR